MNMPRPRRKGLPYGRIGPASRDSQGQTAIEYMILLGVVVALVLVALKVHLPRTRVSANVYFDRASLGIIGDPNPCGDGLCCPPFEDIGRCPPDCDFSDPGSGPGCPDAVCTNPFDPSNSTVCPGSDEEMIVSKDWELVPYNDCTGRKCEYQCRYGFMLSVNTCVLAQCQGDPTGYTMATMCDDANIDLPADTPWSLVPNGGCSAKCQYECIAGYIPLASGSNCELAP